MSTLSENDRAILNSIFNPLLPLGEGLQEEELFENLKDEDDWTEETAKAKELEKKGIQAAEEGQVEQAVNIFTQALSIKQTASGYNNRAQCYRILSKEQEALNDLNSSLNISGGKGQSGCNALCQRGLLFRKSDKLNEAKADFQQAASLGSQFAKQQLVEMNPYAAMCNQMLNEMMAKLTRSQNLENGHGN